MLFCNCREMINSSSSEQKVNTQVHLGFPDNLIYLLPQQVFVEFLVGTG